jgi:hypothetical protein
MVVEVTKCGVKLIGENTLGEEQLAGYTVRGARNID